MVWLGAIIKQVIIWYPGDDQISMVFEFLITVCSLLKHCAVSLGEWLLTFRRNFGPSSSWPGSFFHYSTSSACPEQWKHYGPPNIRNHLFNDITSQKTLVLEKGRFLKCWFQLDFDTGFCLRNFHCIYLPFKLQILSEFSGQAVLPVGVFPTHLCCYCG